MTAYKYTVVIPHKNCPDLLARCVNSIPERDDLQVIVVDDNSDDENKPNIRRSNVEIIFLDSDQSKGAGKARNVGLEYANGEWLIFADSDDFFYKGFWDSVDSFIIDNTVDIRYFCVDSVDSETLQPVERASKKRLNGLIHDYREEKDGAEDDLRFHYNVPWGKIFKRDFLVSNNIKFDEVPVANDVMFSAQTGNLAHNIAVYENIMYVVTSRPNSLVTKVNRDSLRCRFMVSIRYNKYCESVGKKNCIIKLFYFIKTALRQYGPIEICWYINKLILFKQNPFKGSVK